MVASHTTNVLPQSSFPHGVDHTLYTKRCSQRSSNPPDLFDAAWSHPANNSPQERVSLPSPPCSPKSSHTSPSSMSSQSLTSLTPSMSPSSIVSLQRVARQGKKHSCASPSNRSQSSIALAKEPSNRSAISPSVKKKKEKRSKDHSETTAPEDVPTSKNVLKKPKKGISGWALSMRQSLSSKAVPQPPLTPISSSSASISSGSPRSLSIGSMSSSTVLKHVVEEDEDEEEEEEEEGDDEEDDDEEGQHTLHHAVLFQTDSMHPSAKKAKTAVNTAKSVDANATAARLKESLSSLFPSLDHSRVRVRFLRRNRKKKLGTGMITVFCVTAVVILILC
ncbi:MAG: hypothetical protein J3Q66DRAFT_341147 [Benniella sp.]|nr:MAG: hypothetical protein J3Q66DRAFT_341147 [Benniella sp.]